MGGGRRFTIRSCSVLAVHVSTCSKAKKILLQAGGERRLMTLPSLKYKTRADWPPPQYVTEEKKPTLKSLSLPKN